MNPTLDEFPLYTEWEEAFKDFKRESEEGPGEECPSINAWIRSMSRKAIWVDGLWDKVLIAYGTECANCKEIYPEPELEDGMCRDCWKRINAAEAREER